MGFIIGSDGGNANVGSIIPSTSDSYNRELIFDLSLGAFSLYDMGHENYPVLNDYVPITDFYVSDATYDVVLDNGNLVVEDDGDQVTVEMSGALNRNLDPRKERIKYLTTHNTGWTLSEYKDYGFRDWYSTDFLGIDFFSYLITGYDLGGDFMRNKQAPYLLVYCRRTETQYILTEAGIVPNLPSSCIVQVQWDWNDSPVQGQWGTKFQAYRLLKKLPVNPQEGTPFDYGDKVIVTKNKIRGKGRAMSLFIQSDAGKDLRLLGWGILQTKAGEP